MPEWKFVLDQRVFEFFNSTRGSARRKLAQAFVELQEHPMRQGTWRSRDEFGRTLDVELFGKFLIHYWTDIVAKEVRVVGIERVR